MPPAALPLSTDLPDIISPIPKSLHDSLDALTFHASPPPSLTARFEKQGQNERSAPEAPRDPEKALTSFIEHLVHADNAELDPHLIAIGYELEALVSIYSPAAVKLCVSSRPPSMNFDASFHLPKPTDEDTAPASSPMGTKSDTTRNSAAWNEAVALEHFGISPTERIRYEVSIPAWEAGEALEGVETSLIPDEAPKMRVLVSLPPTYPNSSPPQLQLLGRYLGSFAIDTGLFGDITRTYISSSGITFMPGDVCVFEGLTHVQSLVRKWYAGHLSEGIEGEKVREAERQKRKDERGTVELQPDDIAIPFPSRPSPSRSTFSYSRGSKTDGTVTPAAVHNIEADLPAGFTIHSCDPIVDRRSTFIGHAIKVTDEREVPLVVNELLNDKKIAKAAHPAIFAYRIAKEVGGPAGKVYNTDYDDDGETQAGARLKHLLEILELENVLVVVSRWYGGTLLGPDRFKHINQAARDALELGGFLEGDSKDNKGKNKRK